MRIINYLNLTNGIEAKKLFDLQDYRFIRIQSTWCEQKRWEDILFALSDDLLMNLALGNVCRIYDAGANKPQSRAVYQGVEWIVFCLFKRWFNIDYKPKIRGNDSEQYFKDIHHDLNDQIKNKLDYYKKFIATDTILLETMSWSTANDGNKNYFETAIWGLL